MAVTRVCRTCGLVWGVSALDKHGKRYICPRCAGTPWHGTKEWGVKRSERESQRRAGANGGLQALERDTERCAEMPGENAAR